jgi:hypothetical protein
MNYAKIHEEAPENKAFIADIAGAVFFGVPSQGMKINSLRPLVKDQLNESLLNSL